MKRIGKVPHRAHREDNLDIGTNCRKALDERHIGIDNLVDRHTATAEALRRQLMAIVYNLPSGIVGKHIGCAPGNNQRLQLWQPPCSQRHSPVH